MSTAVLEERQQLVDSMLADGWTVEPSRRGDGFLVLCHPSGAKGSSKLLIFRLIGTTSLYGPGNAWRVDFSRDVPNHVIAAGVSALTC